MKFTTLLYLCVLQVLAIDIEDGSNSRGARKLFGGYKITPRYCKPTRDKFVDSKGTNICMFNHECTQRNGQVVGACMDGFLFGACCQLPEGSAGELMDSDLISASNPDNNLQTKPTTNYYIPTIKPTIGDITANGVSKITNSLLNGVLPTAQEDAVVQIEHDQFSTTGVTHPTAPDTILQNTYNEINPEDFKPNDKETTMRAEPTTPSYIQTSPYLNIIYSTNTPHYTSTTPYQRPIFKPKPYKPSNADTYVLVPTITHLTKPNKTQEIESIVNIIQMLNSSTKPPSTSYVFSATSTKRPQLYSDLITRKPPSTSYVFSSALTTRRPEYTPQPTNISPSTYHYITTQKPTKPTKKRTTVYTKIQTYSTSTKRPQYTSSTSYRPAHSTFANSPDAFIVTKKPPSTSYVYSTVLSKRPTTNTSPSYASSYPVTPPNTHTTYPSITPTVIVLSPATSEIAPLKSGINSQLTNPQRKPVTQVTINNHITHNIYSTSERPSPTVLITPKPSSTTNPIYPTDFDAISVEAETSSNDLNNFPPVRNPNLNMSIPLFDETEITTPVFIEDEILNTKIETFVNKIIQGLQEPFGGLKDYVFSNNSSPATHPTTKKPITKKGTTTKKPAKPSPGRPAQTKPTTKRPLTVVITKQPTTTKRTRPTKRITTTPSNIEQETIATISQDYRTTCGVRPLVGNLRNSKIVGGKGAIFGEFPWQVLVRESTWLGLFTKNKCGGVLIGNRYVMTAAHCQPGFLASLVAVFGEFDISGDLESKRPLSRNIKRVIVHRKYDPATFENDLALLELEHPIQFDQHIVPICLPRESEEFVGRMATVTGWGRLKYGGGVPSVLQEVQVPIMENHVCQEMFRTAGHSKVILESFLCAGYANGQKDSCEGDSGGPLVLQRPDGRYQLAGTVSHGIKCAAPYLPGVYMRTSYYKPWIESVTGIH